MNEAADPPPSRALERLVAEAAAEIDVVAVPVGMERLEALGVRGSGAFDYYNARLRRGTLFANYDLALAEAFLAWPAAPRIVHEIGGGYGSLSLLLARLGFEVTCLEVNEARFGGAAAIAARVSEAFPRTRGNPRMVNARFPMAPGGLSAAGAMAVTTNLAITASPETQAAIIEGLKAYAVAIVDIDRFLSVCRTPDDRRARLEVFAAAGLAGQPFLDLGAVARFYRFAGAAGDASEPAAV